MAVFWALLGTLFLVGVKTSPLPPQSNNSNVFLEQINNEISDMKKQINSNVKTIENLQRRVDSYATQCSLEANNACGPCICKEDRRLQKKFFCDCTILNARFDCLEFYKAGIHVDGLYLIHQLGKTIQVFCDQSTDGGGWTTIQRRNGDAAVDFYRPWEDYKKGFGDLQHEFWLGNDNLHMMSLTGQCTGANDLRVDMVRVDGTKQYAKYDHFAVNSEYHKYWLAIGKYTGNASDSFRGGNGMKFTTYDQDNDIWSDNCALSFKSGWWYGACLNAHLNGRYLFSGDKSTPNVGYGVYWSYYLKFSEMKLRRNKEGNCTSQSKEKTPEQSSN